MDGVGTAPWRPDAAPISRRGSAAATRVRALCKARRGSSHGAGTIDRQPLPPLMRRPHGRSRRPAAGADQRRHGSAARVVAGPRCQGRRATCRPARYSSAFGGAARTLAAALDRPAPLRPATGEPLPISMPCALEALYRSGLLGEIAARAAAAKDRTDPLLPALTSAHRDRRWRPREGLRRCPDRRPSAGRVPSRSAVEMLLLSWLLRGGRGRRCSRRPCRRSRPRRRMQAPLALAALDAPAAGQPFKPALAETPVADRLSLSRARQIGNWRRGRWSAPSRRCSLHSPPPRTAIPDLRLAAAEMAARINALRPDKLAALYRAHAPKPDGADPLTARGDPAMRRAALFKAVEAERTPHAQDPPRARPAR